MPTRKKTQRKYSKKGRQAKGNIKACALGAVTGIALLSFFTAGFVLSRDYKVDPKSCCKVDQPSPVYESFVIDLTSPFASDDEQAFVKSAILKRSSEIPVNGRLAISVLAADDKGKVVMRTVFKKCRPDDGGGQSGLASNPKMMQKRFKEDYEAELVNALDSLGKLKEAKSSPLLERFATDGFFPPEGKLAAEKRRLTIVSDLLQKSDDLNQYQKGYPFPSPEKAVMAAVKNSLKSAEVTVMLRDGKESRGLHTRQHREFWAKYFKEVAGAASYEVTTL